MYKAKTKPTPESVLEFLDTVTPESKRIDSMKLLKIFERITGHPAKMWGNSIIGFGKYYYKYESGHSGEAPLVGFSPRKKAFSLYFATGDDEREELLKGLGKHTSGKACVYVKKLEDINLDVLEELITQSLKFLKEKYPQ
ncbi:DUF1801 domain-containing protein [Alkaliphilus pronyensis]|uniref:DUF1801 domain-containing protein n=1 Tax=Alkaliphilus pronyensis TaxID=1482732 RepID=A0A6I0F7Y8_9FIRM|nr:DUF1801 domain-containing protein [Alkaliphilus pronyensis]KAB3536089.1 DUF1801 domain-containing protein [Alkaliphilus pronyensis]